MSPRSVILTVARNNNGSNELRPGGEDRKQPGSCRLLFDGNCHGCAAQFVLCLWASRWLQLLYHVTCKEIALQTAF
jgi:hypothetical protein